MFGFAAYSAIQLIRTKVFVGLPNRIRLLNGNFQYVADLKAKVLNVHVLPIPVI
jgi:hypothetical protein